MSRKQRNLCIRSSFELTHLGFSLVVAKGRIRGGNVGVASEAKLALPCLMMRLCPWILGVLFFFSFSMVCTGIPLPLHVSNNPKR